MILPKPLPLQPLLLSKSPASSRSIHGRRLAWLSINSKDAARTRVWSPAAAATRPTIISAARSRATSCAPTGRTPRSCGSTSTDARKLPGVLDIVTGADLVAAGWKGAPAMAFFKGVGGASLRVPFRTGLAHGRVRFVGEPVALVVAETEAIAQDAAELIAVEYEDLPVAGDRRRRARGRRRRRCTTTRPTIWRSTTNTAIATAPSRASRMRPMWCASSCTRSASPAIRWSRSPASRSMTPPTRRYELCVPTQGASDMKNSAVGHDRACRRKNSASARSTSAAPSACATRSIPNFWRSCWPPSGPAGRCKWHRHAFGNDVRRPSRARAPT